MLCYDCPRLDSARMREGKPEWQPRSVCCLDKQAREMDALAKMIEAPPPAPRLNRRQRRARAAMEAE